MRELVTIQKITNIKPIPGRDRIELITVLGWDIVAQKNIYNIGDYVCFAEIDSVFPDIPEGKELEKFKFRIKTFKVNTEKGPIYGQGYCFPISKLETLNISGDIYEGKNLTSLLGIVKYEPPIGFATGDSKGIFPTHLIPKTDEMRLSSNLSVLEEIKNKPYYITLKCDGTSSTIFNFDNITYVCSRNFMIKPPELSDKKNIYWDMYNKYNFDEILKLYPNYGFQMEIIGPSIQKNRMGLSQVEVRIFNISNLIKKRYVNFDEMKQIIEHINNTVSPYLKLADIIDEGDIFNYTQDDLKNMSNNLKYSNNSPAEGIVIRPKTEQYSQTLKGRLSFKQISQVFLSSGGD